MSLYQNVRPNNLDEIIGNDSTIGGLKALINKEPHNRTHSIIIKGPSGCGKTTIARILAKSFGSDETSIFEYNAANTRGIDTIREISESINFTVIGGVPKTYIFDESHQLTPAAQEALLKLIEDSNNDCYFILCTTSPELIIKTVRNRCSEYEVNLLSRSEIKQLITNVCSSNDIDICEDLIEAITYTCEGSPRAALVSLEQIIGIESVDTALELLVKGTSKDNNVIDLCKLLIMCPEKRLEKWKEIITTYSRINEDSELIRKSIMTFMFNRLTECNSIDDAKDIAKLLSLFSTSTFYGGKPLLGSIIAKACFEV